MLTSAGQRCAAASRPPPAPTALGRRRAAGRAPRGTRQLPASAPFHTRERLRSGASLSVCPALSFVLCASGLVSASLALACKQLRQDQFSRSRVYELI